jgi:phospholipid/cholesterol/gamma-HCH transport system substrate-binding protein
MSTPANHWKLGLFVVLGVATAMGVLMFLGARNLQQDTVAYKSYFDESVQGLEVGSPVKFRGVTIGTVSSIGVAADNRHVEVTCELAVKDLNALGLSVEKAKGLSTKMKIPADLRVQLGSTGITGVKFIQIDFFKAENYPPLALPFEVPENYIPAAPSMMKNLEDSVVHAVDRFPALAEQLLLVLGHAGTLAGEVQSEKIPQRMGTTLGEIDAFVREARITVALLNPILLKAGGDKGLVMSMQRTSDALGGAAQNASGVGLALEDALRDMQSAAASIQQLAEALQRDPDMLLKGRGKKVTR